MTTYSDMVSTRHHFEKTALKQTAMLTRKNNDDRKIKEKKKRKKRKRGKKRKKEKKTKKIRPNRLYTTLDTGTGIAYIAVNKRNTDV